MIEFVTHFTKMETWRSTFEHDKKLYKKIKSLLSIKSLTEYLKLVEKKREKPTDETLQIEMIPCHNLLTEFSGHIADACWASIYTSVLKSMPNLTSVIITEAADKKPVGAFLLLESTNSAGEKVLVIRGINPKKEWIAKIDESSFIEKVIETSRKIASLKGAKLAIVIDDHIGGATSNRPSVYSKISGLKPKLLPVIGLNLNNTEFNGYDITSDTFYI